MGVTETKVRSPSMRQIVREVLAEKLEDMSPEVRAKVEARLNLMEQSDPRVLVAEHQAAVSVKEHGSARVEEAVPPQQYPQVFARVFDQLGEVLDVLRPLAVDSGARQAAKGARIDLAVLLKNLEVDLKDVERLVQYSKQAAARNPAQGQPGQVK